MNDSIKQMQAELAQIEAEIAELEAQKGIQTSQDSQPQSAPQPAQPNSVVFTNGATPQDNYFSWQYNKQINLIYFKEYNLYKLLKFYFKSK